MPHFTHKRVLTSCHRLAAHLLALRTGGIAVTQEEQDKQAYATMQRLVEKYTTTLEEHSSEATAVTPSQQVVVLTGATGALGAHILAQLVALPSVDRVYALVRAKDDKSAAERVASSIKQRKITSIDSVQAEKIVSLASNIDKPDLGLTHERYSEIRDSATAVIAVSNPVPHADLTELVLVCRMPGLSISICRSRALKRTT